MPLLDRALSATRQLAGRAAERLTAFAHAPAVPGTGRPYQPYTYLPRDEKQQQILQSREALYGRTTYHSGETTANIPTYPGSGLSPGRIASIHAEVDITGRMLPKADLDQQVMRRDTHMRAVDYARRAATTSKPLLTKPAHGADYALKLSNLAQAMLDDIDGLDSACFRLLAANGSGFASEEAVFANKAVHLPGNIAIPGVWPQEISFVHNRILRFDPVTDIPVINQTGAKYVDLLPKYKFLFHEGVGDAAVRQRGHQFGTVWLHMIKHDGVARLAQCLDFYGIPHPYAEMESDQFQNETLISETKKILSLFGSGSAFVKDKSVALKATETPAGLNASSMHGVLFGLCNAEMSKAVQGETLTTELSQTGSYNASETHEAVKADIITLDAKALANTVQAWLRAVFYLNRYAICAAVNCTEVQLLGSIPRVYWLVHRAIDPKTRLEMILQAVEAGMEIDEEQVYNENGFRRPQAGGRAIKGKHVIVPDGAQAIGEVAASHGVDNPKDDPAGVAAAVAG